jgi:hypothetical protein
MYLRQIAEGAKATASTLKEATLAAQKAVFLPSFKTGRIVVSNSGGGQSGSFQMAGSGNEWTQDNIAGLIEEFLQMIAAADPVLLPDDGTEAHTEALRAAIAANIMAGNVPQGVTSTMGDFTLLGFPQYGTGMTV